MKRCSQCAQEKHLDEFNNSSERHKQSMCKDCYKAYFKAWRARKSLEKPTVVPMSKTCYDCGLEKPIGQFGKRSTSKDKKNDYCKTCWVIRVKKSQAKAREKKLESMNA